MMISYFSFLLIKTHTVIFYTELFSPVYLSLCYMSEVWSYLSHFDVFIIGKRNVLLVGIH